jgi:hypothetical protein
MLQCGNKISVIVPTLWKIDGFLDVLKRLSKIDIIGEIIVIDNTVNPPELNIHNVVHIKEKTNTFVNPAWNKGFKLSKFEKLCFLNDDVDVDDSIFEKILPHITEDKGMIGLYEFYGYGVWEDEIGQKENNHIHHRTRNLEFKVMPTNETRKPGFGCLWFIHKKSYVEIPEGLRLWYGDDWIYRKTGKQNWYMMNLSIIGRVSQTSSLNEFDKIKKEDTVYFEQL